jgi:ribosome-binding factor A
MANTRSNAGNGPSQRQLRVGELIRRSLSDVLNRAEIHDPDLNRMSITVGEVSMSNDLKVATVYVMPLMGSVPVQEAIAALARNKNELRHRVVKDMTLKYAPDLRFRPDETFDRLDETRRLFSDPVVQRDLAVPDSDDEDGDDA